MNLLSGLLFSKKLVIHDHPTGCAAKQRNANNKKRGSSSASLFCAVSQTHTSIPSFPAFQQPWGSGECKEKSAYLLRTLGI